MAALDVRYGRAIRVCAIAGAAALLLAVPALAQDPDFGIGTPLAESGTGVTAAPALDAIKLASGPHGNGRLQQGGIRTGP